MKLKRFLCLILCMFLCIGSSFSSLASGLSTYSTGVQVFPSWSDFQTMEELARSYGYESYLTYFAAGGTQSDGSATYNFVLYNYPDSLYYDSGKIYNSSSKFYVYCWNVDTESFEYYKYFSSIAISSGDELYFSDQICDSSGTVIYESGPSSPYLSYLEDDPDYQGYISGGDDDTTSDGSTIDYDQKGLLTTIKGFFTDLTDSIIGIFIPSDDFLDSSLERVKSICGLSDSSTESNLVSVVVSFGSKLLDFVSGDFSTPPEIEIDLSDTGYGTGKISFLDFSWYESLKPTCDLFLSSFLWVGYIWILYRRLPGIFSGSSMSQGGAD